MFASLTLVIVTGLLLYLAVGLLERLWIGRWHSH
jgi:hypothetical protein